MVILNQHGASKLVNAQTGKMFGPAREEMIGKQVDLLLPHGLADAAEITAVEMVGRRGGQRRVAAREEHGVHAVESIAMIGAVEHPSAFARFCGLKVALLLRFTRGMGGTSFVVHREVIVFAFFRGQSTAAIMAPA